jgi:hypothetical protein
MIYLPAVAAGITVPPSMIVPFSQIVGTPVGGSNISLQPGGTIHIADVGFYLVTFAVFPKGPAMGTTAGQFRLTLDTSTTGPQHQVEYLQLNLTGGKRTFRGFTTILQVTSNPSNLTLLNVSANCLVLSNANLDSTGMSAYITLVKLRN